MYPALSRAIRLLPREQGKEQEKRLGCGPCRHPPEHPSGPGVAGATGLSTRVLSSQPPISTQSRDTPS